MKDFNIINFLVEGKLHEESYPQVDIEVQGEIYTIPVNYVDREKIFSNAEYELEDLLDSLDMMVDGGSAAAIASDLKQSELVDRYGNEDVRTFKRIKSLGVQVDSLNGILDGEIDLEYNLK